MPPIPVLSAPSFDVPEVSAHQSASAERAAVVELLSGWRAEERELSRERRKAAASLKRLAGRYDSVQERYLEVLAQRDGVVAERDALLATVAELDGAIAVRERLIESNGGAPARQRSRRSATS